MNFRGAEITLGAAHTGGKQNFARPVEFPEDDQDQIFEPDQTGTFIWRRVRMVFSFSVPFTFGANDERD